MAIINNSSKESVVPTIVLCLALACLVLIPLKVIGYGFLPLDDALRHSAKAVSGKSWDEILVLREEAKFDNHPGWHAILGIIHRASGCTTDNLVVFSVVSLSLLFFLIPVFFLDRQEAWLATLLVFAVTNLSFILRLFFGRPYLITMSTILIISFLWPKLREDKTHYPTIILITVLIALATFIHGSWYLLILPIAAFFLAREWRAAIRITYAVIFGTLLGALFTTHPYIFLKQNIMHLLLAFGNQPLKRMLVTEFQPSTGDVLTIIAVLMLLSWRYMRGSWDKKVVDNPIFILVVLSWILGFAVKRFWLDWGMVALASWIACEFQDIFDSILDFFSPKRVVITIALGLALYLSVTADVNNRWTQNLTTEYLSVDNPEQAEWLPGVGGIIYSDDMSVFYETFFKNPHAQWRYMLGFEAALMPKDDLAIFRKIQWNYNAYQSFEPWVKKMKPIDRLILKRQWNDKPNIPGLEWHYAASGIWIGRLPKNQK